MHKLLIPACALLAISSTAHAEKTYNIQLDGLCDKYVLTETAGAIVGQSVAANCDNGNMVGTVSAAKVSPFAKVLEVATNLGADPQILQLLFDIKTRLLTVYYTPDGVTGYSDSVPFTLEKDGTSHATSGLPRLSDSLHAR